MKRLVLALAVAAAAVAALLAGCTQAADVAPNASLSEGSSLSPAQNQIYRCITERGWDVAITWDGGIEASTDSIPNEQRDLYFKDLDECVAEIAAVVSAMTPDEISEVYDRELVTRQCLIAAGFEVGAPPSRQQYIDTFNGDRWSAYGASDVVNVAGDPVEWRKINEACTQPAWSLGVG